MPSTYSPSQEIDTMPTEDKSIDINMSKTGVKDDDIINLVMSNFNDAKTFRDSSGYTQEWREWNDLYRGIPESKPESWMSNKFIPMILSKVETAMANIMGMIWSVNPPIEVKPFEFGDRTQAQLIHKLLKYQFESNLEYPGVYYEFMKLVKSACIYGTGIGKVYWETKWNKTLVNQPKLAPAMNILGIPIGSKVVGQEQIQQDIKVFDSPIMKTCNIDDIFPDPQSIDINDSWVIHRTRRSVNYLKTMHKNFPDVYNKSVLDINEDSSDEIRDGHSDGGTELDLGRQMQPQVNREKGNKLKRLYEWWGDYDIKGNGECVPCVFTVCDHKLIRKQINPFFHQKSPFVKAVYIPNINDFYGIGIPEMICDLQHLLNETVNQRVDNISLSLNIPIKYRKGSGISLKDLTIRPGGMYGYTGEANDISFERIDFVARDSFNQTNEVERWAQEVTAVTKLTLGTGGNDSNSTATGMALLQQASGNRFAMTSKMFENMALKEIAKMFYQLDFQFIDEDEVARILGSEMPEEGWVMPSPVDISKNYDFIPAGVFSMENKQQKSLRLIQFYNIVKGNPMLKEDTLLRKIYSLLEIGDDPKELLRSDEEMAQYLQKMQEMQGAIPQTTPQGSQGGEGQARIPGMPKDEVGGGNTTIGVPGVPPTNMAVPPGEQVR